MNLFKSYLIYHFILKRVSLRRATGGSIKDYTDNAENEDGVPLKDIMKLQKKLIQDTDKHKNEEATINWQTKLFSKVLI